MHVDAQLTDESLFGGTDGINKRTVFRELKSVKQDLKNCLSKEGWYL